ncbi:DUF3592 domain-containing protein [Verrucomicrobia bacterium]|nr:DUF3592 domain-containing protein [Verrucomicrobiota bacterium]
MKEKALPTLAFVVFLFGGVSVIIYSVVSLSHAKASKNWPTTTGIIRSSMIKVHRGDGFSSYYPTVTYDFEIKGITFIGDRISFGSFSEKHRELAERKLTSYFPLGRKVEVFYKPSNPKISVLLPDLDSSHLLILFFLGVGFLAAGSYGLFHLFRKVDNTISEKRKERAKKKREQLAQKKKKRLEKKRKKQLAKKTGTRG